MQASNRNLIAFALVAALASPAVLAQAKGGPKAATTSTTSTSAMPPTTSAGAMTADSVKTGTRPASPTLPTQADPKASDAITARTTRQESRGTATTTTATTTPTSTTTTMGSGATGSRATSNAGKGNWWADADVDGDGRLSATEAAANAGVNARFTTIDGDKDGFVTQDEYRNFFTQNASQGETHAAAHSMVVTRDTWLKLDGDADSRISLAEAASNVELSAAFTAMDANKDGFVTQDEYRAYAKIR
jgi:hypothetical protein